MSKVMSGGKPVFVSEMYSPSGHMRLGSDQSAALCLPEETFFSTSLLAPDRAGQVRMACWKDSGPILHWDMLCRGFRRTRRGGLPGGFSLLASGGFFLPQTSPNPERGVGKGRWGVHSQGGQVQRWPSVGGPCS